MRLRFDQLGKAIGRTALSACGLTVVHDEIAPDAHHADLRHEPDPARAAERARLGLLGRLASVLCLIEIYSGAPGEDEALACLGKLIAFRQRRRRDAGRIPRRRGEAFVRPFVWIITAGRPAGVLSALAAVPAPGWPPGVHVSPGGPLAAGEPTAEDLGGLLRLGIVVASELPRDRDTILLRLMAAGPALPEAIADLSALPEDAHEHAVASQILVSLQHALGSKPTRTAEEQEFIVKMQNTWQQARQTARDEGRNEGRTEGRTEGRNEGRTEGRNEGRTEGRTEGLSEGRAQAAARAVLTVLRVRQVAVSDAARARILAETDPSRLERWHERAILAASVDDVIDEPS